MNPVVIRFGRLGDSVLLQPMLHRLRLRHGTPCVLVARGAWPAILYAGHADVARVVPVLHVHRPFLLSPERWRAVHALHQMRHAPFYIAEPEPRALGRIRRMLRFARVRPGHCLFLADLPTLPHEHWVDRLLRFANDAPPAFRDAADGAAADKAIAAPVLRPTATDRADLFEWLRGRGWSGSPLVLLQPSNRRTMRWIGVRGLEDDKWWPVGNWVELAHRIRASLPDSHVLLCGVPREASHLQQIRALCPVAGVHVVAGELPLGRLMALLEIAHSMVSVDTGPAHVAAAAGCPVVVLFGRAAPGHWSPRSATGSPVAVLGGPMRGGRVDALRVDEVFQAWAALRSPPA